MAARERKQVRRMYTHLFDEVLEVLRRHDPIRLHELGAPDDEYAPEARTIIPRLRSAAGPDDALRIVHEEFQQWFGIDTAGPLDNYRNAAREIWTLWAQAMGIQSS